MVYLVPLMQTSMYSVRSPSVTGITIATLYHFPHSIEVSVALADSSATSLIATTTALPSEMELPSNMSWGPAFHPSAPSTPSEY